MKSIERYDDSINYELKRLSTNEEMSAIEQNAAVLLDIFKMIEYQNKYMRSVGKYKF